MSYLRIKKHYVQVSYLILGVVEAFLAAGASFAVVEILKHYQGLIINSTQYVSVIVISLLVLGCSSLAMGIYKALAREDFGSVILRSFVSYFLLASPILYVVNILMANIFASSKVIFGIVILSTFLVIMARWVFLKLVDTEQVKRRVLLYGAGFRAKKLIDELLPHINAGGVELVGCVSSANEPVVVHQLPILSEPQEWLEYVRKNMITEIVIVPDDRRRSGSGEFPFEQLLDCKMAGVVSSEALEFSERELGFVDLSVLRPAWLLFSDGFKYAPINIFGKRLTDLVLSVVGVILLWPVMVLTAIAVKLDSKGPVIYSQLRIGLGGKVFRIYKFRSMTVDAEKDGAVWASKGDARVTRVGSFIRNTRLDELPQLYNIFCGDMSFVGPRPERPEFVDKLKKLIPYYDLRHKVKPGLVGWAQLNYHYGWSEADAKNKLQYDLYYVKNRSFFMDFLILIQTVEVILLGKGAQ